MEVANNIVFHLPAIRNPMASLLRAKGSFRIFKGRPRESLSVFDNEHANASTSQSAFQSLPPAV
ncbi:hypothetical protein TSA66_14340 [Noviherbaspirillum autotrophicum]|uniref:Uncharacterized protein n=1 Tax=Noviherbaspirillum autotrophicum TaxID=709839 RepID=A0A0C2BNS4_9BURK|nr:hypothetical protein [Noviherbaspirillum autotrophicum]KIF81704.1 hypothetical protein TSA66_14340 [Noviherbaspirillum autotrophicum]